MTKNSLDMKKMMNDAKGSVRCDEPRVDVVYDWRNKSNERTPAYVYVRVYNNRKDRKYVSTGVKVLPQEWSDAYWVVKRADAVQLNAIIREQVAKCEEVIRGSMASQCIGSNGDKVCDGAPTVSQMKVDRSDASFLDWMEKQIGKERIEAATRKHHRATLAYLMEWGKIRRFEQVTRRNVLEWLEWLRTRETVKIVDGESVSVRISQSTVHGHWKRLRKYVNVAEREGLIAFGALSGITVAQGESKERDFLTDDEIERLMKAKLSTPCLEMARDRFVVQMSTGLSFCDLMDTDFSRREDVGGHVVVSGTRRKTGSRFFLVVLPFCYEIMARWEWKVPRISNVNYNEYLGRVAIEAGIDKHVTSHVARHTYACYCLRHGVRIEAVQRTLGHTKIATTQIYARMMDMDVVRAFDNIR